MAQSQVDGTKSPTASGQAFNTVRIHTLKGKAGDDLKKILEDFAREKKIGSGVLLTCVGSLKQGSVRFPESNNATTITGVQEVVGATGTISSEGIHVHLSMTDRSGKTTGGHLMDGCIVNGLDIVILEYLP
jgi:predicted DNA-binding protein with PD1-like motif